MSKIVVFHGSNRVIKEPEFGYGNKHNDYGLGFYCTRDINAAREWANKDSRFGILNKYEINLSGLKVLNLNNEPFTVMHWITLLLNNRVISDEDYLDSIKPGLDYLNEHYFVDVSGYDVIIGYRADDSYFRFPLMLLENEITLESLDEIYHLGYLGEQIAFMSKKAFSRLKYLESSSVHKSYYDKYQNRIKDANDKFKEIAKKEKYKKGTRLIDLVNK